MIPARASLLLSTAIASLAVAACDNVRKPIRGFDEVPPGSILLDSDPGGAVMMWPMFDLPETDQMFRARLDGRDIVYQTSNEDAFYDYLQWPMQGWTGGWSSWLDGIKPGTHVVEIVDGAGQSWGRSEPLAIAAGGTPSNPSGQIPALVFAHFDGKDTTWYIDPATQDADTTTDEITVTNLVDEDVVVERCLISSGHRSSCTWVFTVAPGASVGTAETLAGADVTSKDDHQALVIHLASDASQSYQRDLIDGAVNFNFGSTCQKETIFVHGTRQVRYYSGGTALAMSSCFGYQSGPR